VPARAAQTELRFGWRGRAGQRGDGEVDDVDAGLGGLDDRGGVQAAGVVGVEVDRDADLLA
jgi:hypothetical protein